jgi:hypothetical protein
MYVCSHPHVQKLYHKQIHNNKKLKIRTVTLGPTVLRRSPVSVEGQKRRSAVNCCFDVVWTITLPVCAVSCVCVFSNFSLGLTIVISLPGAPNRRLSYRTDTCIIIAIIICSLLLTEESSFQRGILNLFCMAIIILSSLPCSID